MDKDKTKEALDWEPSFGKIERPEELWKILMQIPYIVEGKNGQIGEN